MAPWLLHLLIGLASGLLGGMIIKWREAALRRQWRHTSPAGLRKVR